MALNLTQKKEVVAELANVAAKAHSLVAAEYAGMTVGQLTDLRKKARNNWPMPNCLPCSQSTRTFTPIRNCRHKSSGRLHYWRRN